MKKERLKVLEMLESGKISVEEATKLLEALKLPEGDVRAFEYDEAEESLNKFSQSVDAFAKECGDKLGNAYKEMEPKLKGLTKSVIEKTVNVIDDISKSLNESLKNLEESQKEQKEEKCCDEPEEACCEQEENAEQEECCGNGPAPEEQQNKE